MKKIASTIRWDSDQKRKTVASIAKKHGCSISKLVNDWAEVVIAQIAAEASFRAMASQGNTKRALAILDRLNAADEQAGVRNTKP